MDDHLCLSEFMGAGRAADLQHAAAAAIERQCVDGVAIPTVDLGPAVAELVEQLLLVAPILRTELGVEHFVAGGVSATVSRHEPGGVRHDLIVESSGLGSPRLGFVYTFGSAASDDVTGTLRVLGSDGETWHEFEPVDDQLVVFPPDRHHEVGATRGPAGSHRFSIAGFVTGVALHDTPVIGGEVLHRLQQHLLPRITEHGYEVRPIPEPVYDLLVGTLELRRGKMVVEPSDPHTRSTGDADLVDVQDLSDDILRWLQPVHEQFAGMALTPSNIYGIRQYRAGNTLAMHLDRPEALIVSSVLQIAQDVDEPWPLVIERDGRREAVVLEAGQMLLYEGATCSHGRPTPLRGRAFANLFVHYRPTDWTWNTNEIARIGVAQGLIDVLGRATGSLPEDTDV